MKENDKIRGRDVAETRRQCFKIKTGLVELVFSPIACRSPNVTNVKKNYE